MKGTKKIENLGVIIGMKEQKIGENSLIRKYIVRIGMKEQKNRTKKFLRKYIVRIRMMLELECKRTRHGENNVRSEVLKNINVHLFAWLTKI